MLNQESSTHDSASDVPSVRLEGGTKLTKELTRGEEFVIGRSRKAALRIPHPHVAAEHCALVWGEDDKIQVCGYDSESELTVNGRPAVKGMVLYDGDEVSVGPFRVRILRGNGEMAPETENSAVEALISRQSPPARLRFRGETVEEIPLEGGLVFGHGWDADVELEGPKISPKHVEIAKSGHGYEAIDHGETGTLMNGRYFEQHSLIIGDALTVGEHAFVYDGYALRIVDGLGGCSLTGSGIAVNLAENREILRSVGFEAKPGAFVGILGPSGAGKTTLLRALSGQQAISAGEIRLGGVLLDEVPNLAETLGFVPQQEIVHLDLTGREALRFSALLRLPKRTPRREIEKLIQRLSERLGLTEHLDKPARALSGGQLKRLSVCVELLNRPSLLFLDEPTSGLDPEAETELMQHLQELTHTGCTVVATTHVMDNVYLMNGIEVLAAGTEDSPAGRTVFRGRPRAAREFFGVNSLGQLYGKLKERTAKAWGEKFAGENDGAALDSPPHPAKSDENPEPEEKPLKRRWPVPTLLQRQWAILRSRRMNLILLAGQPLIIALLIALTAVGAESAGTRLFLLYIATLWLGCSNAATEIVGERPVFRRERFAGLSAEPYLLAKLLGLAAITGLQALLMLGIVTLFGAGPPGHAGWQILAILLSAVAATGMGLAVSAGAGSPLQAVLMVPALIIPQIVFSGYVFPVQDWNEAPLPRLIGRTMPSFAAQRIMDTSLLWGEPVGSYYQLQQTGRHKAYDNLCTTLYPWRTLWYSGGEYQYPLNEAAIYQSTAEQALDVTTQTWNPDRRPVLRMKLVYRFARPAMLGAGLLLAWTASSLILAWWLLNRRGLE